MEDFIREHHEDELLDYLGSSDQVKTSLNIDLSILKSFNKTLFQEIVRDVHGEIVKWNKTIGDVQLILKENSHSLLQCNYDIKEHIYARFINLPVAEPSESYPNHDNAGQLVELKGIVTYCQDMKLQEIQRVYSCKKCKLSVVIESPYNQMYQFPAEPQKCPNNCKNFFLEHEEVEVPDFNMCIDTQQIRIQEHTKDYYRINLMTVSIDNELVNCYQPGDRIIVW